LNRRFAFFLLMIPLLGYGQESSVLPDLVATSPQTAFLAKSRIDGFIRDLKAAIHRLTSLCSKESSIGRKRNFCINTLRMPIFPKFLIPAVTIVLPQPLYSQLY